MLNKQYLEDLLLGGVEGKVAHIKGARFCQAVFEFFLCSVEASIPVLADGRVELLRTSQHLSISIRR